MFVGVFRTICMNENDWHQNRITRSQRNNMEYVDATKNVHKTNKPHKQGLNSLHVKHDFTRSYRLANNNITSNTLASYNSSSFRYIQIPEKTANNFYNEKYL